MDEDAKPYRLAKNKFCVAGRTDLRWSLDLLRGIKTLYTKEFIQAYANLLKISFLHGESGKSVAIESVGRHSDLALEAMKNLEQELLSEKIAIEEPHVEPILDFVETVYNLCIHQEGGKYHRRDLEEKMYRLVADKEAKVS